MKRNPKRWFPEQCISWKFLNVMKLTLFLCLIATFHVSAMSYAQSGTVSIHAKKAPVTEVLKMIEAQSKYTFIFNNEQINGLKPVTLNVKDEKITKVLETCLQGTELSYELVDNVIVINRRISLPQQNVTIEGVVKDKKGSVLPGVSIFIKGTTIGVATDIDGKFKMDLPQIENVVLVFSFVGMETQEIAYTGQKTLNVVMKEDAKEMEEVVVNGYFTKNKDSFTGTAVVVTKEELSKVSSNNLISA